MSSGLFKFGAIATIIWLLVGVGLMLLGSSRDLPLKPNEWGDTFAGLFAPVAFLWLVLGFLQQGTELQLSTRALELQASELKNSVEQQRELVEVTRKQVAATLSELERVRDEERKARQPVFVFKHKSVGRHTDGDGTILRYEFEMINQGATVANVRVNHLSATSAAKKTLASFGSVLKDESNKIGFLVPGNDVAKDFPATGVAIEVEFSGVSGDAGPPHYFMVHREDGHIVVRPTNG